MIAANAQPRELPLLEGDERLAVYSGSVTLDPGGPSCGSPWPTPTRRSACLERDRPLRQMNGDTLALEEAAANRYKVAAARAWAADLEPGPDGSLFVVGAGRGLHAVQRRRRSGRRGWNT